MSMMDKRKRNLGDESTQTAPCQLRAVAGSGQWLATQIGVDLVARVPLLQGAIEEPHAKDLLQANKLIRAARDGARCYLRMGLSRGTPFILAGFMMHSGQSDLIEVYREVMSCCSRSRACNKDTKHQCTVWRSCVLN